MRNLWSPPVFPLAVVTLRFWLCGFLRPGLLLKLAWLWLEFSLEVWLRAGRVYSCFARGCTESPSAKPSLLCSGLSRQSQRSCLSLLLARLFPPAHQCWWNCAFISACYPRSFARLGRWLWSFFARSGGSTSSSAATDSALTASDRRFALLSCKKDLKT